MSQPSIETARLLLRPFRRSDAPVVQELAGDRAIADTTLNIPHPYEDGMAEQWIESHEPGFRNGTLATFAIVPADEPNLAGAIGLTVDRDSNNANLGYWIGRAYWNKGYATEAARAVLDFGFETLRLDKIHAMHLARNPSSGRVMQKVGMLREGTARQDTKRRGQYEDLVAYGLLRADWLRR